MTKINPFWLWLLQLGFFRSSQITFISKQPKNSKYFILVVEWHIFWIVIIKLTKTIAILCTETDRKWWLVWGKCEQSSHLMSIALYDGYVQLFSISIYIPISVAFAFNKNKCYKCRPMYVCCELCSNVVIMLHTFIFLCVSVSKLGCVRYEAVSIIQFNDNDDVDIEHRCQHKCVDFNNNNNNKYTHTNKTSEVSCC